MAQLMGTIGDFFSGPAGKGLMQALSVGTAGAGLIGNLATERARSKELNYLQQSQKALSDPTAIAKQVAAATQPLDRALLQGVENTVQGSLAEQGLSQAPGIQASVLTQAVAPYQQQNMRDALQIVMQRLGLPIQYAETYLRGLPPSTNLAPLLALLRGGSTPDPYAPSTLPAGSFPNYGPTLPPDTSTYFDPGLNTPSDFGAPTGGVSA